MQTFPLASVIIPSYNSPDIYATLDSVLMQDYPRIQLILIDDCSAQFPKEEVTAYIARHSGENLVRWQVLVNPENLGTVRTMNTALGLCEGDYIFNLASDDCFYDERVLSDWVAEFIRTGAPVITAYRKLYDSLLQTPLHIEPSPEQVCAIQSDTPMQLFERLAKSNFIFGCCTARTAACVREYGFYDERFRLVEDHPMALKLLRLGVGIAFFDRIVIKYRGGGISSPEKYNAVYAQDVDNILKYEVLPYTAHPARMHWAYRQWKRDQKLLRRRAQALQRYGTNKVLRLLIHLWYYLHHPYRTICKLPAFLRKRSKENL